MGLQVPKPRGKGSQQLAVVHVWLGAQVWGRKGCVQVLALSPVPVRPWAGGFASMSLHLFSCEMEGRALAPPEAQKAPGSAGELTVRVGRSHHAQLFRGGVVILVKITGHRGWCPGFWLSP